MRGVVDQFIGGSDMKFPDVSLKPGGKFAAVVDLV